MFQSSPSSGRQDEIDLSVDSPPGQEEETNRSVEVPVVDLAPSPPGQQEVGNTPALGNPETARVNLLDRILPKPPQKSK